MAEFFAAIAVFLAAHVLPAATGARGFLIARIGRPAYIAAYSVVSLVTIAWVILSALAAPYVELWPPHPAAAWVPVLAMLPSCVLLVAGASQPAPLSISLRGGRPDPRRAGLAAALRHPILWAFFLWAASHLVANGDLVSVFLFGSLALFSLFGMKRLERRAQRNLPAADFAATLAATSGSPARRLRRAASWRALWQILIGALLYAALLHLHGPVIGVAPMDWLR